MWTALGLTVLGKGLALHIGRKYGPPPSAGIVTALAIALLLLNNAEAAVCVAIGIAVFAEHDPTGPSGSRRRSTAISRFVFESIEVVAFAAVLMALSQRRSVQAYRGCWVRSRCWYWRRSSLAS